VSDWMRRSRAAYHYAIRKAKRDEDLIVSERITVLMLKSEDRDFWSEIKRSRAKPVGGRNVDGVPDNVGISKLFRDKYQKLYSGGSRIWRWEARSASSWLVRTSAAP